MTSSAFQSYASNQVNGSQFFIPNWKPGEVVLIDKESFKEGMMFSYDKVRQELFIRLKDSAAILQGTKEQIYSFSLDGQTGKNTILSIRHFLPMKPRKFFTRCWYMIPPDLVY